MTIPYLTVEDPHKAIALYEKALGATKTLIINGPEGSVLHAEIDIDGSRVMLGGVWPGMSEAPSGRSPVNFMHYVPNADEALKKAVANGMTLVSEPETMFWGDRIAKANDGHGYEWTFAHEVEKVSEEDVNQRAAQWLASMG